MYFVYFSVLELRRCFLNSLGNDTKMKACCENEQPDLPLGGRIPGEDDSKIVLDTKSNAGRKKQSRTETVFDNTNKAVNIFPSNRHGKIVDLKDRSVQSVLGNEDASSR